MKRADRNGKGAGEGQPARSRGVRLFIPILLLLAGLASVFYGVAFHSQPVLSAAPDSEDSIAAPESERNLIRDITVGGVTRLPSGEILRTRASDTEEPCPT